MMLKMQDGALKLCDSFLENPENLNTTLCFYASQLDIGAARLMHGGKLSGNVEAEPEPPPPPPPPEPEPAPAEGEGAPAEGEAPAEGAAEGAPAEGGDAPAEGAAPAAEGAEAPAAAEPEPEPEAPPPPKPAEKVQAYQPPEELLAIHMCTPAELSAAACVARMVYFTIKSDEPGTVSKSATINYVSNTEGMSSGASSAASGMEAAVDYGVLAGGSMVMLEQVMHEVIR